MERREAIEEIISYTIDSLKDLKDYYTGYGSDLHNTLYNTDYYIVGTYQAKQWLGADAMDIIEDVKTYEQEMFGEVSTVLSNAEAVVNMYVYILGEEVLSMSNHLQEECFDRHLTSDDIQLIIEDLQ